MKVKAIFLGSVIVVLALVILFSGSPSKTIAGAGVSSGGKIGVVNIRKIFMESKKNAAYREQANKEQEKAIEELQQLSSEIKAIEAALDAIKEGTLDYLERVTELAQKRASLPIKQNYYEQQFAKKDMDWTQQLYKEVLSVVSTVAQEKGLEMVFESDDPQFPIEQAEDLMLTIRTHKLLYKGGCLNLTDEVMTRLDAAGS